MKGQRVCKKKNSPKLYYILIRSSLIRKFSMYWCEVYCWVKARDRGIEYISPFVSENGGMLGYRPCLLTFARKKDWKTIQKTNIHRKGWKEGRRNQGWGQISMYTFLCCLEFKTEYFFYLKLWPYVPLRSSGIEGLWLISFCLMWSHFLAYHSGFSSLIMFWYVPVNWNELTCACLQITLKNQLKFYRFLLHNWLTI